MRKPKFSESEVENIYEWYYLTNANIANIAKAMKAPPSAVNNVLECKNSYAQYKPLRTKISKLRNCKK